MSVCRYICKYRSDHRPLQSWASQRTITKCIFLNAYPPSVISVIEVAIFLYRGREADTVRGRLAAGVHLRGCYNPDGKLVDVQEPKNGKEYILFFPPLCPGGRRASRTFSLITGRKNRTLAGRMEGIFTRRIFTFVLAKTSTRAPSSQRHYLRGHGDYDLGWP